MEIQDEGVLSLQRQQRECNIQDGSLSGANGRFQRLLQFLIFNQILTSHMISTLI